MAIAKRTKKKRGTKGTPDPIDKYVGSRVRGRRVGLRLSQTKLGNAIGVTFQQIQKYENGTNRVGASNLFKIATTLSVEVGYFYDQIPASVVKGRVKRVKGLAEEAAKFEVDPLSSREAIELMHNYFRIPDEQVRQRLFKFVKSLAASKK